MAGSISYDPGGMDPLSASVLDDVVVSVQSALNARMIDVPYSSAMYRASAGTWTVRSGDQVLYRYSVFGGRMFVTINLQGTTTGAGMGSQLIIKLPDEYRCADGLDGAFDSTFMGCFHWTAVTAGVSTVGFAFANKADGGRSIRLLRESLTGVAWPSSDAFIAFWINLNFPIVTP